jgi:hypothetical protein
MWAGDRVLSAWIQARDANHSWGKEGAAGSAPPFFPILKLLLDQPQHKRVLLVRFSRFIGNQSDENYVKIKKLTFCGV